jgi:hypothetical protein
MTPDHNAISRPSPFWLNWLTLVCCGVMLFGLALVLAPGLAGRGFGLLLFADSEHVSALGVAAGSYISLLHRVLGAVMFGWSVALLLLVRGPFRRGSRDSWNIVAVSALAWFVPDTLFSLWTGFWQNALLNLAIAVPLAIPLVVTHRVFRRQAAAQCRTFRRR